MKVLIGTPYLGGSHLDAGLMWASAFTHLGHDVGLWDFRVEPAPPQSYYDLFLGLKAEGHHAAAVKAGKRIAYWPDEFERSPGVLDDLREHYDGVATMVRPTPEGVRWIPGGWLPALHTPGPPVAAREPGLVALFGTRTDYKETVLLDVAKSRHVTVWGNGWTRWDARYGAELVDSLHRFSVIVNAHRVPHIGVTRRFFESIACGLTVSDRAPGIAEILGRQLAGELTYDAWGARALVDRLLTLPATRLDELWDAEREAIAPYTYENLASAVVAMATGHEARAL